MNPVYKKPTIVLNMIVKNESHIICRFLESVHQYIDSYVIVDTGSTDNTIQLIEDFFIHCTVSIPGKIIRDTFINFADTRNMALRACTGLSDYILLLDADMVLQIFNKDFFDLLFRSFDLFEKETKKNHAFILLQGTNDFYYQNTRIIPNVEADILEGRCRYWGYTHEYLSIPDTWSKHPIDKKDVFVLDIGDGGSKANKFQRDIDLLKLGIETDSSHMIGRYAFYLANTYYDSGQYMFAIEWYNKRITLGGWEQEIWYSYYRIGLSYIKVHEPEPEKAIFNWIKAYDFYPHRIENLYEIVKYYTEKRMHKCADIFYNLATFILEESPILRKEKDNILFLRNDIYEYLLFFQYTIYAPYLGITNLQDEVVKILNSLYRSNVNNESNDDMTYNRVLSNMKYYNTLLSNKKQITLSDLSYEDIKKNYTFVSSSSCIIPILRQEPIFSNKKYGLNVRMVNYRIKSDGTYILAKDGMIVTENKYMELEIDDEFVLQKCCNQQEIITQSFYMDTDINSFNTDTNIKNIYKGIEDIRIFPTSSINHIENTFVESIEEEEEEEKYPPILFIGTSVHSSTNKLGMVMGEYATMDINVNKQDASSLLISREIKAPFALEEVCEKNWTFVLYQGEVCIVYKWGPEFILCDLFEKKDGNDFAIRIREKRVLPAIFRHVRGSTCGFTYHDNNKNTEIWFVVHLVSYESPRHYYHMFVVFDSETMELKRYTAPFTFEKEPIEYCLSVLVESERVIVSYSTWDSKTVLASYPKDYVEGLLKYS